MKSNKVYKNLNFLFVITIVIYFFYNRIELISYGLPFFINTDEIAFIGSTLSSLSFLTGYFEHNYNPIYAPLINLILILKSIFINEVLINSVEIEEIKPKLYFNTELFVYYGRVASLTISSISIFILYLIFKKFKINFKIYGVLLIVFATSTAMFNIATTFGKNSSYLLIYLIQLYFLIKYLLKIDKFNFKSYILFGLLASLAWGINYWPAFISIYAIFFLHYKKFRLTKFNYLLIFLIIFFIFGPIINFLFVGQSPFGLISPNQDSSFNIVLFLESFVSDSMKSFEILYFNERNIILLVILTPIFFLNKLTKLKKEYLIIFFLIFEPIFLFGISDKVIPQLRYFAGINCVILILIALVLNELNKVNYKYLTVLFLIFNFYFIYENFKINNKINEIIFEKHSFYNFNENINIDRSKILYLINLNTQETLKQNLYYEKLYNENLIKKNEKSKRIIENTYKKIKKIKNTKNIIIINPELKKDITFFDYTYFQIDNLELFFNYIEQDFDYVVIEESTPFYLDDVNIQKKIKSYVQKNFELNHNLFNEDKIFLKSQLQVIAYYTNSLIPMDFPENMNNKNLDVVYGMNYSLYKIK